MDTGENLSVRTTGAIGSGAPAAAETMASAAPADMVAGLPTSPKAKKARGDMPITKAEARAMLASAFSYCQKAGIECYPVNLQATKTQPQRVVIILEHHTAQLTAEDVIEFVEVQA